MNNNYNYFPYNNVNPYAYTRSAAPMYNTMRSIPAVAPRTGGLLSRLFPSLSGISGAAATGTGFSFSNLLNGASKTLGVINQAIPVFNQVKPMWNNAKTMFRMAKAMNSNDNLKTTNTTNNESKPNSNTNTSQPTFFQ